VVNDGEDSVFSKVWHRLRGKERPRPRKGEAGKRATTKPPIVDRALRTERNALTDLEKGGNEYDKGKELGRFLKAGGSSGRTRQRYSMITM